MPSPLRAAVFDMDGVLFDTEPLHMKAWRESLARFGHAYGADFFLDWVGVPDEDLGAFLEDRHPDAARGEGFLEAKRKRFREILEEELAPFPGLPETLARFAARLPLGVATSSQRRELDFMLELTGLRGLFRATCAYNDVTAHKPAPDVYIEAARRMGVPPEDCAAFEDSPLGARAARAAGYRHVLGVASSFPAGALEAAERVFPSTAEACAWLEREVLESPVDA